MIRMVDLQIHDGHREAVNEVLESGSYVQGKKVKQLEEEFANKVDAEYAVAVNSGTTALMLAYEVIAGYSNGMFYVPDLTHISTAAMILNYGDLVLVDVDETATIKPDGINNTEGDVIVPVHLYGNVADIDKIESENPYSHIVCDAAQATAAQYKSKGVGKYGDMTCFSFYATKNMTTFGEGGMITTNSEKFAKQLRLLRSQGQNVKYNHIMRGYNFRMTEVQAVFGIVELRDMGLKHNRRERIAEQYDKEFKRTDLIDVLRTTDRARHGYNQYTILCYDRLGLKMYLEKRGIETAIHYPKVVSEQPIMRNMCGVKNNLCSKKIADQCLSIPVHENLKKSEVTYIIESIKEYYEEYLCRC